MGPRASDMSSLTTPPQVGHRRRSPRGLVIARRCSCSDRQHAVIWVRKLVVRTSGNKQIAVERLQLSEIGGYRERSCICFRCGSACRRRRLLRRQVPACSLNQRRATERLGAWPMENRPYGDAPHAASVDLQACAVHLAVPPPKQQRRPGYPPRWGISFRRPTLLTRAARPITRSACPRMH
ncbi:hypothetical protein BDZ91DRAFT_740180, partial [Kalaharituber pfeilii]